MTLTSSGVYEQTPSGGPGGYSLDNDQPGADVSLGHLSASLNSYSQDRLRRVLAKVAWSAGSGAWVPGAGDGSMAGWLADQIALADVVDHNVSGVIATDVKPQHVAEHPRVTVLRHDIAAEPPPATGLRLVYARCLLAHLPDRDRILPDVAKVLGVGGAVVVEEMGSAGPGVLLDCADADLPQLWDRYGQALRVMFDEAGNDGGWALRAAQVMRRAGLDVHVEAFAQSWRGGTAGCLLPVTLSKQVQPRLLATGLIDAAGLERLRAGLADPQTRLLAPTLYSTVGYLPA
jgi:Methyltransferase domain